MIDLAGFDAADLSRRRLLRRLPPRPGGGRCWLVEKLWLDKDEYPILCVGHSRLRTNRVAFHLWCGPIPPGALVCHRCDTPSCVEPLDHLYAGSARYNARDRDRDRAARRAELHARRQRRAGQLELVLEITSPP